MTMSNSHNSDNDDKFVFVLSLISVNHSIPYEVGQRVVGVFTSKSSAASAAGRIRSECGDFDTAIESTFGNDHIDNRQNPPDNGILLQLGSEDTGEGDYVQLKIEKFQLVGDTNPKAMECNSDIQTIPTDPKHNNGSITTNHAVNKAVAPGIRPQNTEPVTKQEQNELVSSSESTRSTSGELTVKKKAENSVNPTAKKPKTRAGDELKLLAYMKDRIEEVEYQYLSQNIQQLINTVESEANPLRRCNEFIIGVNPQPVNLFELHSGDFWGLFETRTYMRCRLELANFVHDKVATIYQFPIAWDVVVWHYQEMMRLCSSDNLGLRHRFPFLLIHLDRDDDAFSFVRYWAKRNDYGCDDREKRHRESQEGSWLYGHEENCRLLDIFQFCSREDVENVELSLLVALVLIKMRAMSVSGQRSQLYRIIELIHDRNPTMIPALINPDPLLSQPHPNYFSTGKPSECYKIVEDAHRILIAIPGALTLLQGLYGEKPEYNHNFIE